MSDPLSHPLSDRPSDPRTDLRAGDGADPGPESTGGFHFDRETASTPIEPGRWRTTVRPEWNIGDNPNGGYAMSSTLLAMRSLAPDSIPDPIAVNVHFLRPSLAGLAAEIRADVLRVGRRTATVRGQLHQDGKPRIDLTATFGALPALTMPHGGSGVHPGGPELAEPVDPPDLTGLPGLRPEVPDLPPPERCVPRSRLAQGVTLPLMSRVEVRIVPNTRSPLRPTKRRPQAGSASPTAARSTPPRCRCSPIVSHRPCSACTAEPGGCRPSS